MAAYASTALASALAQLFPDLYRIPFRNCLLPQIFPVRASGQKNVSFDVVVAGDDNSEVIAEGADKTTYSHDDVLPATGAWARYTDAIKVNGDALDIAMGYGAGEIPPEIRDPLELQFRSSFEKIAAKISADSYTGTATSPQALIGLVTGATTGLLGTTGTLYGLNRGGTASTWVGNILANGGVARPFTPKLLDQAFTQVYTAQGASCNICITTPALLDAFADNLRLDRRYVQDITIGNRRVLLDGGYAGIMHNGVALIRDNHCPAGVVIGMHIQDTGVEYRQLIQRTDPFVGATMRSLQRSGTVNFPGTDVPLTVKVFPHAIQGDYVIFQAIWKGQLKVGNPTRSFVLRDLAS